MGDAWVTRHVNTFSPRLFSAIRLPDAVLGSRSIIIPLVKSGDPTRSKANCLDPDDCPSDRRRLADDLWSLGLTYLPQLTAHDKEAAAKATLAGRNLDPWRSILAVAHWLQECHGCTHLFHRLEELSRHYQVDEKEEYEDGDRLRVMLRVLLDLVKGKPPDEDVVIQPSVVASAMNHLAQEEELAEMNRFSSLPEKLASSAGGSGFAGPGSDPRKPDSGWPPARRSRAPAGLTASSCQATRLRRKEFCEWPS